MTRRPAIVTQSEVERMIRAAKAVGLPLVRILFPGGPTIEMPLVEIKENELEPLPAKPEDIVL